MAKTVFLIMNIRVSKRKILCLLEKNVADISPNRIFKKVEQIFYERLAFMTNKTSGDLQWLLRQQ